MQAPQCNSVTEHPRSHSFSCYSSFNHGRWQECFWELLELFLPALVSLLFHNSDLSTFFCACLRVHKWPHVPNSFSVTGTWYKTKLSDKISFQQTLYHELSVCTEKRIPNQSKFSFKEAKISSHWEKFSCQMLALQLWPSWLGSYLKQGCNDFFSLWQDFLSLLIDGWDVDAQTFLKKYAQTEIKIRKFQKESDNWDELKVELKWTLLT